MRRKRGQRKKPAERELPVNPRVLALGLFVLAIGLYLNTLGHGFVFDDAALILQNPQVTGFRVAEMFSGHGYRPVRTLTYALNYALGGDNPLGYHLFNVLLHALNALFLFRLLQRWTESPMAAALGVAVFTVHPVQTAAVAYISGRKDLLATLFVLVGLTLYARFRERGGWLELAASMGSFLLAVFSKEVAVVFPVLILAAEALVLERRQGGAPLGRVLVFLKRRWPAALSGLLVAGAGIWFVLFVGRATRMTGYWGGTLAANWGTSLKLFAHYLKLVIWPRPLIADYKGDVFALSSGFLDPASIFGAALLVASLLGVYWTARRLPFLSFGALWFVVSLTPVLQIVPFHELAADHFLYLPMAGVAFCVAQAVLALDGVRGRVPLAAAAVALLALWSGLTLDRNGDWKDSRTLWEATYAAAPGSYRANANLGKIYFGVASSRKKGLELTRRAVELDPDDPVATANLGAMYYVMAQGAYTRGDTGEAEALVKQAIAQLEQALVHNRRDGSVLSNLGNCQRMLGALWQRRGVPVRAQQSRAKAIDYFESALKRDHRDPVKSAWYNLALVYLDQDNCSKAVDCLEEFLKIRPRHAGANLQAGWCRVRLGQPKEAIPFLEKAVSIEPALEGYRLLIDSRQAVAGAKAAIADCERALEKFPGEGSLDLRAGLLYNDLGNREKAIRHLRNAASSQDTDSAQKAKAWLKKLGL